MSGLVGEADTRTVEKLQIRRWMERNADRFFDGCGEFNATLAVETWDNETQDGAATLDPDHPAWEVAAEF